MSDYIDIAATLANDPQARQAERTHLRSELAARPLGNPEMYAREVEGHYRRLWREWCVKS